MPSEDQTIVVVVREIKAKTTFAIIIIIIIIILPKRRLCHPGRLQTGTQRKRKKRQVLRSC